MITLLTFLKRHTLPLYAIFTTIKARWAALKSLILQWVKSIKSFRKGPSYFHAPVFSRDIFETFLIPIAQRKFREKLGMHL